MIKGLIIYGHRKERKTEIKSTWLFPDGQIRSRLISKYGNKEFLDDHQQLYELVLRAVQGKSIERKDDPDNKITWQTPINKVSGITWAKKHNNLITPLRHFPKNEEDLILELMDKLHEMEKSSPQFKKGGKKTNVNTGGKPPFDPDGRINKLVQRFKDKNIFSNTIPDKPDFVNSVIKIRGIGTQTQLEIYEIKKLSNEDYRKNFGFARSSIKRILREIPKSKKTAIQ